MSPSSITLDCENEDTKSQLLLLQSLCQYLEQKGFAKSLKKLCSEAGIEDQKVIVSPFMGISSLVIDSADTLRFLLSGYGVVQTGYLAYIMSTPFTQHPHGCNHDNSGRLESNILLATGWTVLWPSLWRASKDSWKSCSLDLEKMYQNYLESRAPSLLLHRALLKFKVAAGQQGKYCIAFDITVTAVQEAAQVYVACLFEDPNLCIVHSKRATYMDKYIEMLLEFTAAEYVKLLLNFADTKCKSQKEHGILLAAEMDDTFNIGAVETVCKKKKGLAELSPVADKEEEPTNDAMPDTKLKEKKKSKKSSDENTELGNSTERDNKRKEKKKKKSKTGDDIVEKYSEFFQEEKSNKLDSSQAKNGYELETSNEPDNHKKKTQKQKSDAICGSEVKQEGVECQDSKAAEDASEAPIKEKNKKRKKEKSASNDGKIGENGVKLASKKSTKGQQSAEDEKHRITLTPLVSDTVLRNSDLIGVNIHLAFAGVLQYLSRYDMWYLFFDLFLCVFESTMGACLGCQAASLRITVLNFVLGWDMGRQQIVSNVMCKDSVLVGRVDCPKMVKAFQRVKVDEIKFADEKLHDNSYWAKGGAENGYGAKAQEVLGQVKGRDFRHEKTKKKRGSYRGGQIDLLSHSVKFADSDDE
ncbi:Srp40, C-terminal [Dillenia turbinata]|uniref:Srp40, C-terminal n=1 Tax=Dillenia turbinata TaxID=194707 RepID=A0AAN8VD09_9MAGN